MLKLHKLSQSIRRTLPAIAATSGLIFVSQSILAQDAEKTNNASFEKIVVTGSRGAPRSLADSPVPVDVFSEEDLVSVLHLFVLLLCVVCRLIKH
jgi:iron complex outermembrane receptor protein